MVHDGADPLQVPLGSGQHWSTETTGQVFSPQPVRLSGMNHAGKDTLDMVWDVHAERLVSCGDCHYSSYRPVRLAGKATPANVIPSEGIKRRCESCHSLENTHDWLPEAARHFNAVACESCHVPKLEMGARQSIDSTVMQPDGSPLISYRGIDDVDLADPGKSYITGYRPLLRVGKSAQGKNQVLPYNLVTEWYWSDGDSHEPIAKEQLRAAWLEGEAYSKAIMQAFDADRDGQLDRQELRLDNRRQADAYQGTAACRGRTQSAGARRSTRLPHSSQYSPRIAGQPRLQCLSPE